MKKIHSIVASLAAASAMAIVLASPATGSADKVTICHFTSSTTNPYVMITISRSALAKHMDHHGDVFSVNGECRPDGPPLDPSPGL